MLDSQFLEAAKDGRADDMLELMSEGIDKDFEDYVREVICQFLTVLLHSLEYTGNISDHFVSPRLLT